MNTVQSIAHVVSACCKMLIIALVILPAAFMGCGGDELTQPGGAGDFVESPTDLTAEWASGTEILLEWRDRSANEDGFEIFQSTDSLTRQFFYLTSSGANRDSVLVQNKSRDTTYYFQVRAYKGQIKSGFSNVAVVAESRLLKTLDAIEPPVVSLDWFANGTRIAAGCGDYRLWIWDVENGDVEYRLSGHSDPVNWVSWASTINPLRVATQAGTDVRIWDISTQQAISYFTGARPTFSGDGRYMAYANSGDESVTTIVRAQSGTIQRRISGRLLGTTDDGRWVVTVVDSIRSIQFWDLNDTLAARAANQYDHVAAFSDVKALSGSGTYVVKGDGENDSLDAIWAVWRIRDNVRFTKLRDSDVTFNQWAISSNDEFVAASAVREPWYVYVWSIDSGELIALMAGHDYAVNQLDWSPDSQYLASASGDQTIKIWGPFP